MCNYKGMHLSRAELLEALEMERHNDEWLNRRLEESYAVHNGFDYKMIDVVVAGPDCSWQLAEMEWGFIPQYLWTRAHVEKSRRGYKDEEGVYHPPSTTLNARGEELLKPRKMFRDAALHRRCLFPVTEFYEWRHVPKIGKKGQPLKAADKYPYHISVKNEEVFLIAGIWQTWTDRDTGETVDTAACVMTEANSIMAQIHNSRRRMPTMLNRRLAAEWLAEGLSEERISQIANFQIASSAIEAYPVRKDFLGAADPNEKFVYENLSELDLTE